MLSLTLELGKRGRFPKVLRGLGEVAEWSKAAVSKTVEVNCLREFESRPLRQ